MAETVLDLARNRLVTASAGVSKPGSMLELANNSQSLHVAGSSDLSFAGDCCFEWYGSIASMPTTGHLLAGYRNMGNGIAAAYFISYTPFNSSVQASLTGNGQGNLAAVIPLIGLGRHYIVMDRKGLVVRLFVDGALVAQVANTGEAVSVVGPSGGTVDIGRSSYGFLGYAGELGWCRITGASRYSDNYTPSAPITLADPHWNQVQLLIVAGNSAMTGLNIPPPFDGSTVPPVSVALRQVDNGVFDLDWFEVVEGDDRRFVQTLVYAVLFTDAEAPASREPDRYLRRGWWRDAAAGSGLWHIRRQPLGSAARREAVEAVRTALEAHGLTGVVVTERSPAGVSSVVLEVAGLYRDQPFLVSVPL